jgi:DNA-binding protein H-NS
LLCPGIPCRASLATLPNEQDGTQCLTHQAGHIETQSITIQYYPNEIVLLFSTLHVIFPENISLLNIVNGDAMTEFLKTLMNVRSLRAALRELSFEQLQDAKEKFDAIYIERRDSTEKERAEQAEHQRKLAEFTEMLKEAGIDPRDLVNNAAPAANAEKGKSKRTPRPPKYKYQEDGQEKTWTGQGRMPKAIAEQIAQGKSLEQFAI